MQVRWLLALASVAAVATTAAACSGDDDERNARTTASDDTTDDVTDDTTDDTDDDADDDRPTPPVPSSCRRHSDCDRGEVCRNGTCGIECRANRDCCADGTATCGRVCTDDGCVPGSPEVCNGADDDRDGETDEGFTLTSDPLNCGRCGIACDAALAHARPGGTTCVEGICRLRSGGCADGFYDLNGTDADGCEYRCFLTNDGTEEPDGDDNDCDGATDEGFDCARGAARPCGAGTGLCQEGQQRCQDDGTWSDCEGAIGPLPEVCNGRDDDCNGIADDGFDLQADVANCGACGHDCRQVMQHSDTACVAGQCMFRECLTYHVNLDQNPNNGCEYKCPVIPVLAAEVCDAERLDENCNGQRNEGCTCVDGDNRRCGLDPALHGVGICRSGTQGCVAGAWEPCVGAQAPRIAEACNGLDDDCDGTVPADELDGDRDGYAACAGDCDDTNRDVNPEGDEVCNMLDDDCDGDTDENYFVGAPCRGVGACGEGVIECASTSTNRCSTDIGGSDYPTPAPLETCDFVDNDCNGVTDLDADASVVANDPLNCGACGVSCAVPNTTTACVSGACTVTGCTAGLLLVDGACLRCDVWPIAAESCDAGFLDEDCDGSRNEDCACTDDASQSCGLDPALDRVGVCRLGRQTCAGGQWGTCTGAVTPSSEACNGLDDDCDGTVPADELDGDRDGYAACAGDCDDTNRDVNPEGDEVCNMLDDDCDGTTDEDYFVGAPCVGSGTCAVGERECATEASTRCSTDLDGSAAPDTTPTETCDNLADDDCDGSVDEGCGDCTPGVDERPCGVDSALRGVGICRAGVQVCEPDRTWGTCEDAVTPWSFDMCDKVDNDCDGETDEGYDLTSDPFHCGSCGRSCYAGGNIASASCVTLGGPCDPEGECAEPTQPTPTCAINKCAFGFYDFDGDVTTGCEHACFLTHNGIERCDGLDNDCDGVTDEPPTCAPPPPNAPMTFSVTPPAGFPNDATTMFCATFVNGLWSCGGYPVTETTDPDTGATTYTTSGAAIAGNHEFGLCTAGCDTPTGTWVVTEDTNGLLVEAATPTVTYDGTARPTNLGRNGQRGGNWVARFD